MTTSHQSETTTLGDFADFFAQTEPQEKQPEVLPPRKVQAARAKPQLEPSVQPAAQLEAQVNRREEDSAMPDDNREFLQVATALSNLKAELMQAGLLQKNNVKSSFLQVTEFVATRPQVSKQDSSPLIAQKFRYQRQQMMAIATQMQQAQDLEILLNLTVDTVRESLPADRVLIYRFSSASEGQVIAESVDSDWATVLGNTLPVATFGANKVEDYLTQQMVIADDTSKAKITPYQRQLMEQIQVKSILSIPVVIGGKLWGLLVAHQCREPRQWQETETTLFYQVTLQLASTLQEAEFSQQLKEQACKENVLTKLIDQIRESLDSETIFRVTTREVRRLLKCDRVGIYKLYEDWSGEFIAESVGSGWLSVIQEEENLGTSSTRNPGAYQKQDLSSYDRCNVKRYTSSATLDTDTYLKDARGGKYNRGENSRAENYTRVDDIYAMGYTPCYLEVLEKYQCRASLITPIFQGTKLWGLLAAYQNSGVRHWQDDELTLMLRLSGSLGVALQQATYLTQVREQAEERGLAVKREQTVSKIVERIRQTVDLPLIFKSTTQEVRQLLKCDRLAIYRFNPDWSGETVAESVAAGWISLIQEQQNDNSLKTDTYLRDIQGGAYAKGDAYNKVNDIYALEFAPCYIEFLEKIQARAYVIVPIFQKNELWGLLAAYQNSGVRIWEEAEVNLMGQIASQLGMAVRQAEYVQRVKMQADQLTKAASREKEFGQIITKVGQSVVEMVRQSQSLDIILGQIAQQVRQFLLGDRVIISRFNAHWHNEILAEAVGKGWSKFLESNSPLVWEDIYLQENQGGKFRKKETLVVHDIAQVVYSQCYGNILEQMEAKAYMVAPIWVGSQLWGLLAIYQNAAPRQWDASEENLLTQLGAQLGIGIQQGEFLSKVQKQAQQERALVNATESIRQSLDIVRESLDIHSVFSTVTQEVRQLLKADRVAVYQFSPDWSGTFISESVATGWERLVGSEVGTNVRDTYLKDTEGGRYRNRESLAVDDIYTANHNPCHVELLEKFQARAYVLVPVFVEGKLWGILGAYQNSGTRKWDESEVTLLNQIALQLGFALNQTLSLEKLRNQSEQLTQSVTREKSANDKLQQQVIQMLTAVRPVLSGDLTVRVPVSEDAVGTIADAYNNTIQSLRKIVTQVQSAAVKVSETSSNSETAIATLSHEAQQQFVQVTQAIERIESMVNSTQAVATNAKQVETAVQQANQTVKAGDTAMNKTVDGIMAIRETVAETSKKIKRLSESSQKISKVVSLISNFTTQTQLLALNASIEATRAGEYGRGFSVVADEVRSLSRQSAEATREIEKLVQEIQAETVEVTTAMDLGIQQVVGGTNLVNETRQQLNEIVTATAQISQLVQGITQATQVQTQQSQLVTQAMSDVAAIANKNSTDSTHISASFQELLATAQQLQASVGQFKVN
ncbi:MAG: GAF domain-containing protein [Leptolyngbyaceae cyanobacterium CSU_1_4]|nr:GAF domain-containing protein [Leptolyngbyaceae cyanobacterium CSU_1_4]